LSASSSSSQQTSEFEDVPQRLPSWKQEVNARLDAHRTRRTRSGAEQPALPGLEAARQESRAARVAARVAERYSKAPTYSEMLAAEAANAARAAEAAALAAQQAHAAAQAILTGLGAALNTETDLEPELGPELVPDREPEFAAPARALREEARLEEIRTEEIQMHESPALIVEPAAAQSRIQYHIHPDSLPQTRQAPSHESQNREPAPSCPRIIEDYPTNIEDPFEDAFIAAAQPLPAKLIEFPRELVATRKARPRIAEGPLRDAEGEPEAAQLRIFEVEPEAISHEALYKEPVVDQILPEWHSIQLEAQAEQGEGGDRPLGRQTAHASGVPARRPEKPYSPLLEMLPLHIAPMEDRLMAGIVDAALVLIAFTLFVLVFVACTAHPPMGKPAFAAAVALLVAFFALYQWLFFTYADGTPGMRYAKIALCTFDDENPTRKTMRNRVAALLLSALPLGLGVLWAFLDDDRMTWHDRITRTYQRSYR
jgi:uncharacterized RDD family membrane protein YckC